MPLLDQFLEFFNSNTVTTKVAMILVATFILSLITRALLIFFDRRVDQTDTPYDDAFVSAVGAPLRLMIWVVGLGLAFQYAEIGVDTPFAKAIAAARNIGVIFSIAWFLVRFINFGQKNYVARKIKNNEKVDQTAVDSIGKLLRLVVFISATLVALQTLGFSIAGVLTFGGIGGIAIGFAAKDMLSNFFGGLMIYLDRPFSKGDWVRSPDREIEGVVEDIGWRITLIRNFESRPLYVPNSAFSTIAIENVSRMTNRRIYETIGIRYDDASAVDKIVEDVRAYLHNHEDIDDKQGINVSFTTFAPSSLDFFIYCFTKSTKGIDFYRTKQEIMLQILKIIESHGAECAFPTTTIYMQPGGEAKDE